MLFKFPYLPLKEGETNPKLNIGTNDEEYHVIWTDPLGNEHECPLYSEWISMLRLAELHSKEVYPKWLHFSEFKEWLLLNIEPYTLQFVPEFDVPEWNPYTCKIITVCPTTGTTNRKLVQEYLEDKALYTKIKEVWE